MKKILLFIFLFATGYAQAQTVGDFRYDTTKFRKIGGFNEVKIQNSTMGVVGGVFTNVGNGWGKWIVPSGSGSDSTKVDSVTTNSDSTALFYWVNGVSTEFYNFETGLTGGDTTILETVLDSTGQPGQRILWAANKKIRSSPYLLFDSARRKVVIGNQNISVGGNNTKLFVTGNTQISGSLKVGSIASDDTETNLVVYNTTDQVFERRTVASLPTSSGTVTTVTGTAPVIITSTPTTTPNVTVDTTTAITGLATKAFVLNNSGGGGTAENFRRSITKVGDSVYLENDLHAPGANKVYGTDSLGVRGFQTLALIDPTGGVTGDVVTYNGTGYVLQSVFKEYNFAATYGQTTYTDAGLSGKHIRVWREGFLQTSTQATLSGTTITFSPALAASERVYIETNLKATW